MKKQESNTPQERKMKFAEAGVMFVLVMALTVFIGVKVASHGNGEELITEPVIVTETTVTVEAEHPSEIAAEPAAEIVAEVVEAPEPRVVTYAEAEKAFFDRKYDEAADMFGIYTDKHPANAWGFYMLGLSEWKAGDNDAAEEAFVYALEIKPDHAKSLINYGRVLLEQGRQDEAKTQIELALAANPASNVATRVLGRIQHNQGLLEEAASSYLTVLRTKEDDAWSLNNLGLIRIQQGRYEEALPALAKAAQIDSSVACFQNNLGMALERTGHITAAGEAYAAALKTDEDYAKADISLARVSELTEDADQMPVDLAVLADSFSAADDMEVAAARDDDDTPQN